ncbi:MAG: response regulator [Magnetococcales bacterium]|nr:response regulator [Magnetococcales bacterium]
MGWKSAIADPVAPPSGAAGLPRFGGSRSSGHLPFLLGGGLSVILVIAVLTGWAVVQNRTEAHHTAEVATANLSRTLADNLNATIAAIDQSLHVVQDEITRDDTMGPARDAALLAFIARLDRRYAGLSGFRIYGPDGRLRLAASNVVNRRADNSDQEDFKTLRDHADAGLVITAPIFGPTMQQWAIRIGRRITNPDGSFGGAVYVGIPVKTLEEGFKNLDLGPDGTVALYHTNHTLAARFPISPGQEQWIGQKKISDALAKIIDSGVEESHYDYISVVDGVRRIAHARRVPSQPYVILVGIAEASYLTQWRQTRLKFLLFAGIITILVIASMGVLHHRIVERQKITARLAESEERHLELFQGSPDAYLIVEPDSGRISDCNRAAEVMLRGPRERILGLAPDQLSPDQQPDGRESKAAMAEQVAETLKQGRHHFAWLYRRLDGEHFWAEVSVSMVSMEGRRVLLVAWRDITDRKRVEAALTESEMRFRLMTASIKDYAIFMLDPDGRVITWNEGARLVKGYESAEILGQSIEVFYPPEEVATGRVRQVLAEAAAAGRVEIEGWRVRKDGTRLYANEIMTAMRGDGHALLGFVEVTRDVTERKRAERQLQAAKVAAEAANQAKSAFLANMSHEIRTPMNAILGMADLLWESNLAPEQRKFVQVFRSAGENLLGIINDILDLSKIEAGQLTLERIPFNPADEMAVVCDIMAMRASAKGLHLLRHVVPGVPEWLEGDPTRLRQIFLNLLSNAVKFTEQGAIRFEVAREEGKQEAAAATVNLVFRVIDTGIGIPEDRQALIFENFVQADTSTTRRYGGTGLGLAIVKKLVEKMDGRIRIESQPGQGTAFIVTIPFSPGHAPDVASSPMADQGVSQDFSPGHAPDVAVAAPGLHGTRLLLVGGEASDRRVLRQYLEEQHAEVEDVASGFAALRMMERAAALARPFQSILLELHLPDMDGFRLVACWRDAGHQALPILMLPPDHQDGQSESCEKLGIRHHLIKPVRRADLINMVATLPPLAAAREAIPAPAGVRADTRDHPRRILLVDDSEDNRMLIEAYLEEMAVELHTAENGRVALDRMQQLPFDLVLMDVQMPELDGYAATGAWREHEQRQGLPRLPIVALTAHALHEDIVQSLKAGCDAHLAKPIKKKTLLATLQRYAPP